MWMVSYAYNSFHLLYTAVHIYTLETMCVSIRVFVMCEYVWMWFGTVRFVHTLRGERPNFVIYNWEARMVNNRFRNGGVSSSSSNSNDVDDDNNNNNTRNSTSVCKRMREVKFNVSWSSQVNSCSIVEPFELCSLMSTFEIHIGDVSHRHAKKLLKITDKFEYFRISVSSTRSTLVTQDE